MERGPQLGLGPAQLVCGPPAVLAPLPAPDLLPSSLWVLLSLRLHGSCLLSLLVVERGCVRPHPPPAMFAGRMATSSQRDSCFPSILLGSAGFFSGNKATRTWPETTSSTNSRGIILVIPRPGIGLLVPKAPLAATRVNSRGFTRQLVL